MARKFMMVSAGILMVALAWHPGASTAVAQSGQQIAGFATYGTGELYVITSTGEVYERRDAGEGGHFGTAIFDIGNFWQDATTSTRAQSWGALKAKAIR